MRRRAGAGALCLTLLVTACGGGDSGDSGVSDTALATTTNVPSTTTTTAAPALIDFADAVTISGTALPPVADPRQDGAVGQVAPTVEGVSFDGTPVSITHNGNKKVLLFLAHWCSHCQGEVEELAPWFEANPPPDGVDVVSIATGSDEQRPNFPPSEWLKGEEWPLPVMVDTADNDVGTAFGLTAFPYWVVLDGDGTLLARTAGSLPLANVEALFTNLANLESSP